MRFAGKHKLNGIVRIVDKCAELFGFTQQQIPTLVPGDASREADGQNLRVKHCPRRFDVIFTFAAIQPPVE